MIEFIDIPKARYHCGGSTKQLREEREFFLDHIENLQKALQEKQDDRHQQGT